jgi:hypothetical protein
MITVGYKIINYSFYFILRFSLSDEHLQYHITSNNIKRKAVSVEAYPTLGAFKLN